MAKRSTTSKSARKARSDKHAQAQKARMARKDRDMYEFYTALSQKKVLGVPMLTTEAILAKIDERFYLDPTTSLRRIRAFARNKDKDPAQLTIPLSL